MVILLSLLIFFINFISFYVYNLSIIDERQTKKERKKRSKRIISKLFFIDTFKISNKFFWMFNFVNIVISLLGIIWFCFNYLFRNDEINNFIGGFLLLWLFAITFFMLISKLIIHIIKTKNLFGKIFIIFCLVVIIIGIILLLR